MKYFLQLLSPPLPDTSPSFILHFDSARYLFNAGEGTQRFCNEHRVKLGKVTAAFVSGALGVKGWERIGGLPGLLLTLADASHPQINLFGPRRLTHGLASTRNFVVRRDLGVDVHEFGGDNKVVGRSPLTMESIAGNFAKDFIAESNLIKKPAAESGGAGNSTAEALGSIHAEKLIRIFPHDPIAEEFADANIKVRGVYINPTHQQPQLPAACHRKRKNSSPLFDIEELVSKSNKKLILSQMFAPPANPSSSNIRYFNPVSSAVVKDIFLDLSKNVSMDSSMASTASRQGIAMEIPIEAESTTDKPLALGNTEKLKVESLGAADPTLDTSSSLSYIIKLPDSPGKFQTDIATSLGVPKGRLFGKLQRGESITLDNGSVVTSDMVMRDKQDGGVILVVDCPSPSYIPNTISNPQFNEFSASPSSSNKKNLVLIIHILAAKCLTPDYTAWMKTFGLNVQHLILSEDHGDKRIIFKGAATLINRLEKLESCIFGASTLPQSYEYSGKAPVGAPLFRYPWADFKESALPDDLPANITLGKPMQIMHLAPKVFLDDSQVPSLKDVFTVSISPGMQQYAKSVQLSMLKSSNALNAEKNEKDLNDLMMMDDDLCGDDVVPIPTPSPSSSLKFRSLVATPLGTGSALPSKTRNVSSTVIQIPEIPDDPSSGGIIFLDTGEGSLGQLIRAFGPQGYVSVLKNLRVIYISHLHADHHLGTISLIKAWRSLASSESRIFLIAPHHFLSFLSEYAEVEDFGIDSIDFIKSRDAHSHPSLTKQIGLWQCIGVDHCPSAFACVVKSRNWSFAYSGDCRPSQTFSRVCADAGGVDLMLHEATFSDAEQSEAILKKHCTIAEALEIGTRAQARHILLTHFSQRYPKIPVLGTKGSDGVLNYPGRVMVAFDLMNCDLDESWRWKPILEGLEHVFEGEVLVDEAEGLSI